MMVPQGNRLQRTLQKADTAARSIEVSEGKLLANNIFSLRGKVTRGKTKIPIRFIADKDGRISVAIQCNGSFSECRMCDPMPSAEQIEESSKKLEGIL